MQICRRTFLKAARAWLVAARPLTATGNAGVKKPNIILCMADDQGWGDMAYNGHPVLKTPHFDAMAAAALRFDRFYAAAPVCSPTRGSVMTGRHPNRFGCFKWGHPLRPQEITVAEALKTAGYVTGHFGKWHLGSVVEGSPVNPGASGFDEWLSAPNFFDNDPILSREGTAVPTKGESSMVTADAAIEFIRKHAKSPQPFFAVVWFGSPHGPHQAIERDRAANDLLVPELVDPRVPQYLKEPSLAVGSRLERIESLQSLDECRLCQIVCLIGPSTKCHGRPVHVVQVRQGKLLKTLWPLKVAVCPICHLNVQEAWKVPGKPAVDSPLDEMTG